MSYPNPWKLATVCLAAAGVSLWIANRHTAPDDDFAFVPLTSGAGLTASPAISADGQLAAYASDREGKNLELYSSLSRQACRSVWPIPPRMNPNPRFPPTRSPP